MFSYFIVLLLCPIVFSLSLLCCHCLVFCFVEGELYGKIIVIRIELLCIMEINAEFYE